MYSLIIETFNLYEGTSSYTRLKQVMDELRNQLEDCELTYEVLLLNKDSDITVLKDLSKDLGNTRILDVANEGYDDAKTIAAHAAAGQYLIYLDSDCVPQPGWLRSITYRLSEQKQDAIAGFTSYEGGYLAKLLSVLDFGFLMPNQEGSVGCYASNNVAFTKALRCEIDYPKGDMRCLCYAHAQKLSRLGHPVQQAPEVRVKHALPSFFKERFRRGRDIVIACHVDPQVPETRYLRYGLVAPFLFWFSNLRWDFRRLRKSYRDVDLSLIGSLLGFFWIPVLRLPDLLAMLHTCFFYRGPGKLLNHRA